MKIFYRDQEYDLGPLAHVTFLTGTPATSDYHSEDRVEIERCYLEPEDQERLLTQWRQAAEHPPVRLIWDQPGHGPVMLRARLISVLVEDSITLEFHIHQRLSM